MKAERSRTAETSAAQRALHTLHAHAPKIFEDPFALDLSGPKWRWIVGPRPMAWLLQRGFPWMMPMVAHHLARARYVETRIDEMLPGGLSQYVLLGAGMDSFVLRRPELASQLSVFEVDHPGSQAWKRQRMEKLGLGEPSNVEYIAVDFEVESLADGLERSSFTPEKLSLFAWMGVMPYLSEASIMATLRDLTNNAASGSELVFDTMDRAVFGEGRNEPISKKMFASTEKWGEPIVTGYDPHELEALLGDAGLDVIEVMSPAAFTELWFSGRKDGLAPWEHMYVVRARVR